MYISLSNLMQLGNDLHLVMNYSFFQFTDFLVNKFLSKSAFPLKTLAKLLLDFFGVKIL